MQIICIRFQTNSKLKFNVINDRVHTCPLFFPSIFHLNILLKDFWSCNFYILYIDRNYGNFIH
jgi:hypothetical protein